jgi:tetratricopeptide (TPR) repeat protein
MDPAVVEVVARAVDPRRAEKLALKLNSACSALERERYSEAKRIARSLIKELASVSTVHEVIGLASYRLGQWRDATNALEMAQQLNERVENMPVLADCYRAQKRWSDVDMVWKDLKEQSPAPDVMAEGRIVVAGSLADRGDIRAAIDLMRKSATVPRRVREYHVRQWYVLADLYDRAGDIQRAREFFSRVAAIDPKFADVRERLSSL